VLAWTRGRRKSFPAYSKTSTNASRDYKLNVTTVRTSKLTLTYLVVVLGSDLKSLDASIHLSSTIIAKSTKKSKKAKKQPAEDSVEDDAEAVLVDVLISLLSHKSSTLRAAVETVFRGVCSFLQPSAIKVFADILTVNANDLMETKGMIKVPGAHLTLVYLSLTALRI